MCRSLVDVQSNFTGASERDVANLRMRHQSITKARSSARTKINNALWHAAFFQQFDELSCNSRRIARRLQGEGVAAQNRSQSHARHDGAGKIPRRNHGPDTEWNVSQGVALA